MNNDMPRRAHDQARPRRVLFHRRATAAGPTRDKSQVAWSIWRGYRD